MKIFFFVFVLMLSLFSEKSGARKVDNVDQIRSEERNEVLRKASYEVSAETLLQFSNALRSFDDNPGSDNTVKELRDAFGNISRESGLNELDPSKVVDDQQIVEWAKGTKKIQLAAMCNFTVTINGKAKHLLTVRSGTTASDLMPIVCGPGGAPSGVVIQILPGNLMAK